MTTQKRKISVGESVAMSLINDQAGSLVDGWREALQNALDSEGATQASLEFDHEESVIFDNGEGMDLTDDKMASVLDTLGETTKDPDDDQTIGQFGIGFGQVLAKGAVIVHSKASVAVFDVAGKKDNEALQDATPSDAFEDTDLGEIQGLDYALSGTNARCGGFEITVLHYEDEVPQEGSTEWDDYEADIRRRFKYVGVSHGIEVSVNGEVVSDGDMDHALSESGQYQREVETEDFVIAVEHSVDDNISVYSNGLYVTEKPGTGLEGVVVTKKNLSLNFARNEVKSGCDLWAKVEDKLSELREEILDDVPDSKLNKKSRQAVVRQVREGKDEWKDREVLKQASGDPVSIEEVEEADEVVTAGFGDEKADKLEQRGVTVLQKHDGAVRDFKSGAREGQVDMPPERSVSEKAQEMDIVSGHDPIPEEEWSWGQKARVYFAQELADKLASRGGTPVTRSRDVRFGEDDTAAAWTDGQTYVYLTEGAWTASTWRIWTVQVFETVCHELAHEEDDTGSMVHGEAFNRRYQKLVSKGEKVLVSMMEDIDEEGLTNYLEARGYDL